MSNNKAKRHIHKYCQVFFYSTPVWACALEDCNHYMPDHMKDLVPGKASLCWKCGEKFNLNAANMRDRKPLCADCSPIPETTTAVNELEEYLRDKGIS
jgi:hypothetical protein